MALPNSLPDLDCSKFRLLPRHWAQLKAGSGISAVVVGERGYFSITSWQQLVAHGFRAEQWAGVGLALPVHQPNGGNGLYVYRPDEAPVGPDGRERKYLLPVGAAAGVAARPVGCTSSGRC